MTEGIRRLLREPRIVMLGVFGLISLTNYALGVILGRILSPGDYGLFAFGQTVGLIANLILTLGLPPSLTASMVRVMPGKRPSLIRGALLVNLAVSVLIVVVTLVLFAAGPLHRGLETQEVAAIVIIAFPFMAFSAIAQGSVQGDDRFGLTAGINALEVVSKALIAVVLVAIGLGAAGALAGITVSFVLGTVLGVYYLLRVLRVPFRGPAEPPATRLALPLFAAQIGLVILLNLDLLFVKTFAPNGRVLTGYYQAGTILANAPYYLAGAALVPILFNRVARSRDIRETRHSVAESLILCAVLVLPFEIPLVLFPKFALSLFFPAAYDPGAVALRFLAIGNAALIPVALLGSVFQALGRARIPASILLAVTPIEALVLWKVIPTWQIVGASTTFAIAASVCFAALAITYMRQVGGDVVPALAWWVLRYLAAVLSAAVAGLVAWRLTSSPIVTLCAGAALYFPAVLLLRLIAQEFTSGLWLKLRPSQESMYSNEKRSNSA